MKEAGNNGPAYVRECLEAEGYEDFDLSTEAGLRDGIRQLQVEGERLIALAGDLREVLDYAVDSD